MSGPPLIISFSLYGHTKGISSLKFSPDGRLLASISGDKTIRLWQAPDWDWKETLDGQSGGSDVAWSPNSRYLVSAHDDGLARVWKVDKRSIQVFTLRGHTNHVYATDWNTSGNLIATGSFDETIRIWEVKKGLVIRSIAAHSDPITAVKFSPVDMTLLASSSHDGLIRLWDVSTGQCLKSLVGETNTPVSNIVFSPNGRYILASTLDGTIRCWDYRSSKCARSYTGHVNGKHGLGAIFAMTKCIAKDGREQPVILCGSETGDLCIWDLETKALTLQPSVHKDACLALDAHPSLDLIATASLEREPVIKLWLPSST